LEGYAVSIHRVAAKKSIKLGTDFRQPKLRMARYGGDEFAIILPGMGYERCRSVVDRLSKSIVELGYFDHVSIGAALYPEEATTAEELVNLADTRMYRDKHRSKHPAYPDPPPVTS
jgi:diguanylate cyclase (GGDEF)-like protein